MVRSVEPSRRGGAGARSSSSLGDEYEVGIARGDAVALHQQALLDGRVVDERAVMRVQIDELPAGFAKLELEMLAGNRPTHLSFAGSAKLEPARGPASATIFGCTLASLA